MQRSTAVEDSTCSLNINIIPAEVQSQCWIKTKIICTCPVNVSLSGGVFFFPTGNYANIKHLQNTVPLYSLFLLQWKLPRKNANTAFVKWDMPDLWSQRLQPWSGVVRQGMMWLVMWGCTHSKNIRIFFVMIVPIVTGKKRKVAHMVCILHRAVFMNFFGTPLCNEKPRELMQ